MNLAVDRTKSQHYTDTETGRRYWSVSEALCALDPEAFSGVDQSVLASAQQRGTDLHWLFAMRLFSIMGINSPPDRPSGLMGGYYDALETFMQERKPVPIKVEQSSMNESMGYAGTPDTECWLDDTDSLIDLKTGPPRAVHAAQLHAYKKMEGYEKVKRTYSLYITKDGSYKLIEHTHEHLAWSWFQAGLSVLNGRKHYGIR